MSVVATAVIGSAIVGGVVASNSASKAANAANNATAAAASQATSQLEFDKAVYADQKPIQDALNKQALESAQQDSKIAADSAERSKTAWEQNQAATQGSVGQMGLNALGAQYLKQDQIAELPGLQQALANGTAEQKTAAQLRLAQLQKTAEEAGIAEQNANASRTEATALAQGSKIAADMAEGGAGLASLGQGYADKVGSDAAGFAGQQTALGEEGAQSILGDAGSTADAIQATARQRAADNELRGETKANADIANSADQAQRQLLRLGGDPNKMAAMSADIANSQQLARIASGNQVAGMNVANLNTADDKAFAIKSTALDAARASRINAKQAALGITMDASRTGSTAKLGLDTQAVQAVANGKVAGNQLTFAGQQQADTIRNNAKAATNANLNSLQQGAANFGAGFANTSGQNAQNAIAAGTAATNGLNTANNSSVGMLQAMNGAVGNINTAARNSVDSAGMIAQAGQTQAKAIQSVGGLAGGYLSGGSAGLMSLISSSKKVKKNIKPVSGEAALSGLADAAPKAWDYKAGEGDGGAHVGPIAEDMQEAFGDDVAPDGKKIDVISSLGLQHAAINELAKKVKRLERRG